MQFSRIQGRETVCCFQLEESMKLVMNLSSPNITYLRNRQQVDYNLVEVADLLETKQHSIKVKVLSRNTIYLRVGSVEIISTCKLTTPLKKFLKVCPPETSGLQKTEHISKEDFDERNHYINISVKKGTSKRIWKLRIHKQSTITQALHFRTR